MKKYLIFISVVVFVLSGGYQLFAQKEKEELSKLISNDNVDVNTIALYS